MAKVTSKRRLLDLAKKSQLVEPEQIAALVHRLQSEPEQNQPKDADQLADCMVQAGLLNRWQVDNLLKGKYKGFTLGKYKLLGHLGTGGMSSVYLAEHPIMERLVAIKVLPKRFVENPNYLERFQREARAVAALDHPNIVRAFDIDQDGSTHYIVMEYVEGRDLQKTVNEDGPLAAEDALEFVAQAALGIQHAHDAGLIHRDVKPANCLVDKKRCVKLLDLGLAMFSQDDRPSLSAKYDDSIVGTADYLAPEQARNSHKIDGRADIYGLGCTLYFLLTGRPPFPEGTIAERLLQHQSQEPTSLYKLQPQTPQSVVDLCRRMMKKSPQDRIQTATQVAEESRAWLNQSERAFTFGRQGPSVDHDDAWNPPQIGGGSSRGSRRDFDGSSDTVRSLEAEDTHRIESQSTANDDLDLAPLDESPANESGSGSGSGNGNSGLHDDVRPTEGSNPGASDPNYNDEIGSTSTIEELNLTRFGADPLDALLDDPSFSRPNNLPKTQLSRKSASNDVPPWVWVVAACIVGGIFLIALATLLR